MYIKQRSNVIFRDYGSFGYVTDNRNFGYKQANDEGNDIGDKVVSHSGAVFLSVLERKPQTLDCLAEKISLQFAGVNIETIKSDAREFYHLLELDGFIVSGDTVQECDEKAVGFSYKKVIPNRKNCDCSPVKSPGKSTQEFFAEYYKDGSQLTNLHMEITSECNERCVHCYIPHENKTRSMDPALFYRILEQGKQMNLLHLTISGGEPMIHNSFVDFLRKCNEHNLSVNILSNLTLLNGPILEEMKRNHLLSVQTSLYSMDATIHDAITQRSGSFEKTMDAILTLIENDIPLQISCPILKQNMDCYYDVVNWCKEHNISAGIDYVIIARYNHTTQNLCSRLSKDDVKEVIEQRIVNEPHYLEQMVKETEKKKDMKPDDFICSVCHSSICIAENGNVYPCAGWQDFVLGSIDRTPLSEIWHDSTKVRYLRDLKRKDFPKCIHCPDNEFCTMCMVRNANEHAQGDPLVVNEYFCSIARLSREMATDWKRNRANSQSE